ncbi:MAG: glutamine synthetase [Gammaproteobacteria bacterium]|nr:glutamine synthetase [Gammaproteobacteria bacterium]
MDTLHTPSNSVPGAELPPRTSEEARNWLRAHHIEEAECITPDLAGVARGKAMPAAKFADLKASFLPISIFHQSITGNYARFDRDDFWTERDVSLVPDLSTWRFVPWANEPTVLVIHDLHETDGAPLGCAPRNVLKRVLALYAERGWRPVVAPEMEFYLTQKNSDPDIPLQPPVGRSGRRTVGRQSYSIAAVDEYESVIELIYDYAEAQRLEIDTIIQEGGAAQLEINLQHGDPLELADRAFLFKRMVREAAIRHDCYATFMARPMNHEPGSAMHIHQSVVDARSGRNLFSREDGSASNLFEHFIGGQQKYLPAAIALMAPYVNSYRRLTPGEAAPINLEWGVDNRSVGLRVPRSESAGRRLENRLVGADANPYLAIAASLACGYLGMVEAVSPREPFEGDAYSAPHTLPRSLLDAMILLENCPEIIELLGREFIDVYCTIKHHEFEEFMRVVTPWERENLLLTV